MASRAEPTRRRPRLLWQLIAAFCLVSAVTAGAISLVAVPGMANGQRETDRQLLAAEADSVAAQTIDALYTAFQRRWRAEKQHATARDPWAEQRKVYCGQPPRPWTPRRLPSRAGQQLRVYPVCPGQRLPGPLAGWGEQLLRGANGDAPTVTSFTGEFDGAPVAVEARLVSVGDGQPGGAGTDPALGVLLVHSAQVSRLRVLVEELALPIGAGLLAGVALSLLVAAGIAGPVRRASAAAHQLAGGQRQISVPPRGSAELADLADSLNSLAAALARSEDRQRQFLLSVSHELRTPLTAIKGYSEALADDVLEPTETPEVGRVMLAEAERLEHFVRDLLDLARLQAVEFPLRLAETNLEHLVRDAAVVWRDRCAAAGVELRLELASPVPPLRTDPTRIRQILDGLAENALRLTPAGAPIVFALRVGQDRMVLEVRDGGPGLTDADLAVAFERSALSDRYRGRRRASIGIGLALIGGLTGRLGGRATAGHAVEGGASFRIELPLTCEDGSP